MEYWILIELGIEFVFLVKDPKNGTFVLDSSSISNGSLYDKSEEEFNDLLPKKLSSKIIFFLKVIYRLIGSNIR